MQNIRAGKREQTQTLNFFLVLTCLSTGSCLVKCPLWSAPKIGTRKLLSPYIFVAGVQLYVFTLLRLAVNSPKATSLLLTLACHVGCRNIRFRWLCTCEQDFEPPGFFLVIFNYLAIWRLISFFLSLFI